MNWGARETAEERWTWHRDRIVEQLYARSEQDRQRSLATSWLARGKDAALMESDATAILAGQISKLPYPGRTVP